MAFLERMADGLNRPRRTAAGGKLFEKLSMQQTERGGFSILQAAWAWQHAVCCRIDAAVYRQDILSPYHYALVHLYSHCIVVRLSPGLPRRIPMRTRKVAHHDNSSRLVDTVIPDKLLAMPAHTTRLFLILLPALSLGPGACAGPGKNVSGQSECTQMIQQATALYETRRGEHNVIQDTRIANLIEAAGIDQERGQHASSMDKASLAILLANQALHSTK